jgi:RNA polymerase sigma-70 factor, ECF subfamily
MLVQQNSTTPRSAMTHMRPAAGRLSELSLSAAARSGDSASFDSLCAPHMRRLLKTALNITQNREDAEDAVQDSLMRAFVRINDFRGDSSFSTWLTRIVINSALMIRRKNCRARYVFIDDTSEGGEGRLKFEIPHSAPDPAQIFVARERRTALRKAISSLRPKLRSVVEVGHLQDVSINETAKVLNISVAAAKGRLFHARAALRRSAALRSILQSRTEHAA